MNIKKIEDLMKVRDITKIALAEQCGLSRVSLDKALKGADIRVSTLEAIARALDVSPAVFFEDVHKSIQQTQTNSPGAVQALDSEVVIGSSVLAERLKNAEIELARLRQEKKKAEREVEQFKTKSERLQEKVNALNIDLATEKDRVIELLMAKK